VDVVVAVVDGVVVVVVGCLIAVGGMDRPIAISVRSRRVITSIVGRRWCSVTILATATAATATATAAIADGTAARLAPR